MALRGGEERKRKLTIRHIHTHPPHLHAIKVFTVLQHVSTQEGFTLPEALGKKIAEKSDRNLRKAILMLEATKATL